MNNKYVCPNCKRTIETYMVCNRCGFTVERCYICDKPFEDGQEIICYDGNHLCDWKCLTEYLTIGLSDDEIKAKVKKEIWFP